MCGKPSECIGPITARKNKGCASVLSGKDIQHRTMKNMNKSFSRSLREQLREGMILYAAANNCFPIDVALMHLYQETLFGEVN